MGRQLIWVLMASMAASFAVVLGWRGLVGAGCAGCGEYTVNPRFSAAYNDFARLISTELPRKKRWTSDDARLVGKVVEAGSAYPEVSGDDDFAALEPWLTYTGARDAIAERLRRGPELYRGDYDYLKGVLVEDFNRSEGEPRALMGAIQAVCYAGLVDENGLRTRVSSMMQHHEQPIAQQARRQLEHHDMIARRHREGSWRERRLVIIDDGNK